MGCGKLPDTVPHHHCQPRHAGLGPKPRVCQGEGSARRIDGAARAGGCVAILNHYHCHGPRVLVNCACPNLTRPDSANARWDTTTTGAHARITPPLVEAAPVCGGCHMSVMGCGCRCERKLFAITFYRT